MKKIYEKILSLEDLKKLPEVPGVYFFLGQDKAPLYIGKATSLRDRVRSYFARDLLDTRGPKIVRMLEQARFVGYRRMDSVLEALLLESYLIKELQPPYNTDAKDDKSYNHIVITKEKFPRVLMVRGRDIAQGKFTDPVKYMYGPFPHGMQLREALKIVRRLFPFRDKCVPYDLLPEERREKTKPCFSAQIGLCPGVCIGKVNTREYGQTIRHIRLFFEGHKNTLVKMLEREMKQAAKELRFEQANEIKKTLFGLHHIQDIALLKDEIRTMSHTKKGIRIEAYDVAHLGGKSSVGVMTVVEGGRIDKDEYRLFRLRGEHGGNDLSALEEILTRRLKHGEWGASDVVVVDGSFLQLGVAEKIFTATEIQPLLVGVVKDERHQPKGILNLPEEAMALKNDILLANSEAHRFAIGYHRKRRGKEFLK